ncbi:MAG: hypothetical protein ACOX9C_13255 [Kiritimatiellia bacterium]|jgi:hypothetical protein
MKPLRSACFAIPAIVLGALAAPLALADANFNNATGDYLWFNPLNWSGNTLPLPSDWTYINNSAMAADKKTSETSPAILHSATETADVTFLHLGWGAGDSGWLDVQSDLTTLASTVANSQNAQGGLRFSGGTVTYGRGITCGQQLNATGVVEIAGAAVSVAPTVDYNIKLGENGNGVLRMKSGTLRTVGDLIPGNNPTASGTVDVSGGSMWIGRNIGHWMGRAAYRQSGGFASIGNTLTLGSGVDGTVPSQGSADISGGTLVVSNKLFAGQNGSCNWSQTGGTVRVGNGGVVFGLGAYSVVDALFDGADTTFATSGEIYLSSGNGSVATLTQKNGALTTPIFNLASKSNAVARCVLEGGSLSVSNILRVGHGGFGAFEQSGGSVYVKNNIHLPSQNKDAYNFGVESVYRMTGGTLRNDGFTRLGVGGGRGRLELLGGTATFGNFVFVGNGNLLGRQGRGTLLLGGEMNATFLGETAIGAEDTDSRGTLHICGGGTGERKFQGNLYLRNDPTIKATIDAKGLNPVTVNGYFEVLSPVTLIPDNAKDAKPGTYTVLQYTSALVQSQGCDFAFDPSVDTARWKFNFDPVAKKLTLTLRDHGTTFVVR